MGSIRQGPPYPRCELRESSYHSTLHPNPKALPKQFSPCLIIYIYFLSPTRTHTLVSLFIQGLQGLFHIPSYHILFPSLANSSLLWILRKPHSLLYRYPSSSESTPCSSKPTISSLPTRRHRYVLLTILPVLFISSILFMCYSSQS